VYLAERGLKINTVPKRNTPTSTPTDVKNVVKGIHRSVKRFRINARRGYNGIYVLDESMKCCGKHVWRSTDNIHIIFWTGASWILTYTKHENEMGPTCGGLISSESSHPYSNGWNISGMTIDLL